MADLTSFNLDSFKANFETGSRAYLFYIYPLFPTGTLLGSIQANNVRYFVKSSTLPDSTIEEIQSNWQGYDYKVGGKLTYTDWVITFNVDMKADLYASYLQWHQLIHDPTTNVHSTPSKYFQNQQLELLGLDGSPTLTYNLIGAWPKVVGQITLDYAQNDIAQFDVTFAYMYHVTSGTRVTYGKSW